MNGLVTRWLSKERLLGGGKERRDLSSAHDLVTTSARKQDCVLHTDLCHASRMLRFALFDPFQSYPANKRWNKQLTFCYMNWYLRKVVCPSTAQSLLSLYSVFLYLSLHVLTYTGLNDFFFEIPFYLQSVLWSEFMATEARVRFPALTGKSYGSGTGSTQNREYNWGATW
jgi:hypothetical protein